MGLRGKDHHHCRDCNACSRELVLYFHEWLGAYGDWLCKSCSMRRANEEA